MNRGFDMLSTKFVKIHGMQDDRWTVKDKINQYRGVLNLHERDKKVRVTEAAILKKKIAKDLKTLTSEVKEYRGIIRDVEYGEKRRMHTVLCEHRDFQLAYESLTPSAIEEGIFQDSSLKRRQLDKLYYEKRKKMKEFFDLKLECAILSDKYESEQESLPNYQQQRLIAEYQQFMAKQNAAKSIRATYQAMLKILHKDAKYYDAVLESLQEDHKDQCKVMLKTITMGQLAAENLDDTKRRYKSFGKQVWSNMKERERSLNLVRVQVEDLWAYAQSLVRVESDTNVNSKDEEPRSDSRVIVNRQIGQLQETFNRVKDTLGVRSYDQLLSRLDAQIKHKELLHGQFEKNFKERDRLLDLKNHALLVLATLEHGTLTTTGQYKTSKRTMLDDIESLKKRESDYQKMRKSRGELLVKVRSALQNMLGMLICISDKGTKKGPEKKGAKDKRQSSIELLSPEETQLEFKFEGGALDLLNLVNTKVNALFAMSNVQINPEDETKARDLYQSYVADYRSKMKYEDEEPEPTGIFVEAKTIDPTVVSRADIKLRSQQLIEANRKPE